MVHTVASQVVSVCNFTFHSAHFEYSMWYFIIFCIRVCSVSLLEGHLSTCQCETHRNQAAKSIFKHVALYPPFFFFFFWISPKNKAWGRI